MRLFGLIGYPLTHSFSKKFFTEKFEKEGLTECRYDSFSVFHLLMNWQIYLKPILNSAD